MRPAWTKTLVDTQTSDGLRLDGVLVEPLVEPPVEPSRRRSQFVIVWIHGFGANFYFAPYLRLAEALAERGQSILIGNTRGHDFGTLLEPAGRAPYFGGAAWERLEEAHDDLAAWINFAAGRGFAGVVLAGHSVGAVKVTAYQAQQQDARVRGVILASPPLRPSWDTRAYPAALAQAQHMAAAGQAETLFAGPWGPVSAQTYLSLNQVGFDQFGRGTGTPNLALIRCPVLVLIGTEEKHVATPADLEIVRRAAPQAATQVIEGADHFYTGRERDVAEAIVNWADALQ
jgi:alpha-beta hydrolase superfamily lysophospholipase